MTLFSFAIPLAVLMVATLIQFVADLFVHFVPGRDAERDPLFGAAVHAVVFALIGRWMAVALAVIEAIFRIVY